MYAQANPTIHHLPAPTAAQSAEMASRAVLICGNPRSLVVMALLNRDVAQQRVLEVGAHLFARPLQAPYGQYQTIDKREPTIVALHTRDNGDIEVFGPFASREDGFDYFPDHSSPHDTTVRVFSVHAEMELNTPQ